MKAMKAAGRLVLSAGLAAMTLACAEQLEQPQNETEQLEVGTDENALWGTTHELDLIISEEHKALCGHDYANAHAFVTIRNLPFGRQSLTFRVFGGNPDNLYTVWTKLDGTSPLTGAGATPAAPTTGIDNLLEAGPAGPGDPAPRFNGFYTNHNGYGRKRIVTDWRLSNGVYPFSQYDPALSDVNIGDTPFTFRMITHCADGLGHGMIPGPHEPVFQISL